MRVVNSSFLPILGYLFVWGIYLNCCASAQAVKGPSNSSSQTNPVVFGTNTNLLDARNTNGSEIGVVAAGKKNSPKKKHKGEFAFAPIPLVNPSIGNGGGLAVLYARHMGGDEDISPPSTFGAGGFLTGTGSWSLGLGARLNLKNDRYRITVGGGGGKFNYSYFGTGNAAGNAGLSIPLSQRSKAFLLEPKIRVFGDWYLGPRYHIVSNEVSLNNPRINPEQLPVPLPDDLKLRTAAVGIRTLRDSSDNPFYPKAGSIFDTLADFYGSAVGGQKTYQNVTVSYNKYLGVGNKNIFAIHASICLVTKQAPFYDNCELGRSKDLRGYPLGRYRDNRMIVGQAEYRRELFWRLGAVAFAGAGAVAHTWSDFGNSDAQPGGGFGLRFVLAKRNHINLRADYAWGNGSRATYISLGEAF